MGNQWVFLHLQNSLSLNIESKILKFIKYPITKLKNFESIPDSFENLISKLDAEEIKEYKFSFDPYLPHYLKN